eukprot:TRINITY_DN655_c0_g1_i3.p1 TRINITY_DN655_c0_g1~~TRINITY_DN655_c0_g1_i3.p1  ORF type:complete len:446 (+),score=201.14 TRINITY_DN655_c0_g1_i3:10-1347(+)
MSKNQKKTYIKKNTTLKIQNKSKNAISKKQSNIIDSFESIKTSQLQLINQNQTLNQTLNQNSNQNSNQSLILHQNNQEDLNFEAKINCDSSEDEDDEFVTNALINSNITAEVEWGDDWYYSIQCDSCNVPIEGPHWTCKVCTEPTVELCDECIKKQYESDYHKLTHDFVRVFDGDGDDASLEFDPNLFDNISLQFEYERIRAEISRIENQLVIEAVNQSDLLNQNKLNELLNIESSTVSSLNANINANINTNSDEEETQVELFEVPEFCIPIRTDVRNFNWYSLGKQIQFDVILMDPPWQLANAAPTRGVALSYKQLPNSDIQALPIPALQTNGFLFIWVINSRYSFALELFKEWGYKLVDDIAWVKMTCNRRLAKGHGFYLQHAKETCLVGKKGEDPPGLRNNILSDVIYSERRGQSQKPEEIYHLIETLIPNGNYLILILILI